MTASKWHLRRASVQDPQLRLILIKIPWVFIRVLNMNPDMLGVLGPGFLNQVPTFLQNSCCGIQAF